MRIFNLNEFKKLGNNIIVFPTGSKKLNDVLGGGFKTYTINEIYGEAGSGKTRLLHQLAYIFCLTTNRIAYYVDNDSTFRPEILENMSSFFGGEFKAILNRIFVTQPLNEKQFLDSLEKLIDVKESLVLIDTITTHLRSLKDDEYEKGIKSALKKIIKIANNNCCVIFSNQVRFDEKRDDFLAPMGGKIISEIINVRIKMVNEINRIHCIIENYSEKNKQFTIYLSMNQGVLI